MTYDVWRVSLIRWKCHDDSRGNLIQRKFGIKRWSLDAATIIWHSILLGSLSLSLSQNSYIAINRGCCASTLRWPVTRATSRISFALYARLLLTRNYQWHCATIAKSQAGRASENKYLSTYEYHRTDWKSRPASGGESNTPGENIRDTDWQVFPRARENRSRNSRASLSPRSTDWYPVA